MRFGHYTVVIEPDEEEPHRYNVRVPALPGCLTYGESIDDALANAIEAIQGYVAVVVANGEPVPVESHPSIAATIAVPLVDVPDIVEPFAVASASQERAANPRS
jgi:antitoxin HicB